MKKNTFKQFETVIIKTIEKQKSTYLDDIKKSTDFESYFMQVLKSPKTINLRSFIRDHLNANACLYGVPVLTLISPDFTFERDVMSAIAVTLTFDKNTKYKLHFANLTNMAAFTRVQAYEFYNSKKLERFKFHNSCFIETEGHVIFPAFNFIVEKTLFYKMTDPVIYETITNTELEQCVIYKRMKKNIKKQNTCDPVYDYTFVTLKIDELLIDSSPSTDGISVFPKTHTGRLKQLDSQLYYYLIGERKVLAEIAYNIAEGQTLSASRPSSSPENDDDFQCIYKMLVKI